jgi:hypothetical protein
MATELLGAGSTVAASADFVLAAGEETTAQVKHMVDRFLAWKLPENFSPDGGVEFFPLSNPGTEYEQRREPVGTNLLTAAQAEAMVRHMMVDLPEAAPQRGSDLLSYPERLKTMASWRGRRLMACRVADVLTEIVERLGIDNGKDAPPDGGLPKVNELIRIEISNTVANLLRTILIHNDGHVSGSKLQRF